MPTLINSEPSEYGETVTTAEFALFEEDVREYRSTNQDSANDTTLSGTQLEAALADLRLKSTQEDKQQTGSYTPMDVVMQNDESSLTMDDRSLRDLSVTLSNVSITNDEYKTQPDRDIKYSPLHLPPIPRVPDRLTAGPNEQEYKENFKPYVDRIINDFRRSKESHFRDYRTMNDEEKSREQQNILNLLQRLGIRSTQEDELTPASQSQHTPPLPPFGRSQSSAAQTATQKASQSQVATSSRRSVSFAVQHMESPLGHESDDGFPCGASVRAEEDDGSGHDSVTVVTTPGRKNADDSVTLASYDGEMEESMVLLTPKIKGSEKKKSKPKSQPVDNLSPSSASSIEVARAASFVQSPSLFSIERKRQASVSGKRGLDRTRARNEDSISGDSHSFHGDCTLDSPAQILTSHHRQRESSLLGVVADRKIFSASQSPISPRLSSRHEDSDTSIGSCAKPDLSFPEDDDEKDDNSFPMPMDDSTDSILEMTMTHEERKKGERRIGLKAGETFHIKPLETELCGRDDNDRRFFPDPLEAYDDELNGRLVRLYDRLLRRDKEVERGDAAIASGVFLSLEIQHIHDVTVKLLRDTGGLPPESQGDHQRGQTLIVGRSREDLEDWSRTFREGSRLSVMNHSILPVRERKSLSTVDKLAKYDVVLTTFDALKSSDVTVTVDSKGYVSKGDKEKSGWQTSRSSSQSSEPTPNCQSLSVIHRLEWRRVIFVDTLGRKSFLAKLGTSRQSATRALNGEARFIFFLSPDDCSDSVQALRRSDKNVLKSLRSTLRIEGPEKENKIPMIDFAKAPRNKD